MGGKPAVIRYGTVHGIDIDNTIKIPKDGYLDMGKQISSIEEKDTSIGE